MPSVVVIGGGIGGMSAAHELCERGFEVIVLERRHNPGGKARSIQVEQSRLGAHPHRAHTPQDEVAWAPGEHGFRFFPGFYRHVVDTMARTPDDTGGTVADHLVSTSRLGITQYGQPVLELPARFPRKPNDAVTVLQAMLVALSPATGLEPEDLAHFGARIWQILTSSGERRLAEYEKVPWWTFVGAETRSESYQKFLASGITRSLVAAKARSASTRTIGDIFVQLVLTIADPLAGSTDRVLDGPTSHVWIEPWRKWIETLGGCYRAGVEVLEILCADGRISGVVVQHEGRTEVVRGDYYVCALPIERTAPLMTPAITGADPALASLEVLAKNVEWMNGIQFYLGRDVPMLHGHVIHIDTEWALTTISQAQFWKPEWMARYAFHGQVQGILSVDVSDWEEPGLNGRPAFECSREELALEVWEQLKRSVAATTGSLADADLRAWFLDPDIRPDPLHAGQLTNIEPLLVNLVDTWRLRPQAVTGIPNFFLASDYVQTFTDLATMEAANEAARRAVNGLLETTGFNGDSCAVWPLEEPPSLAGFREYDAARFRLGLPWDSSLVDVLTAGWQAVDPVLDQVQPLLAAVEPLNEVLEQIKTPIDMVDRASGLSKVEKAMIEPLAEARAITAIPPELTDPYTDTGDAGTVEPSDFQGRLSWYRSLVADLIKVTLPAKEPRRHLYAPMTEFVDRPAKGLRPALCLATCGAYGGRREDAIPSAAGLELLHNAFLVHDDIEDGSESRRGKATLQRQVGVPLAVNIGDALNAYAMRLFRSNGGQLGAERALAIAEEVDHLLVETLEGQAMELGWIRDNNCSIGTQDYLKLILKKTAWYSFIHPMRIGALAAGSGAELDRFNRFGYLIGAAFQIQDDLLNLVGSQSRYGKEIGGDLSEGKRTLVLSHALSQASPSDRARLEQFLARPQRGRLPREVLAVMDILHQTQAIEWTRSAARSLADAAVRELPAAFEGARDGPDLEFVHSLVAFLVERDV